MTGNPVARLAQAKINLTLHVTGQRSDGYHMLDSLVCFAGIGDEITVAPSDALRLAVTGPMARGVPTDARNLVWKAAELFMQGGDVPKGAHIALTKYLPNAAGIGGGSADAAATLLALAKMWDVPLPENVVSLGADVPVCLAPMALRMRGIGDDLSFVPALPPLWAVLVNPGVGLETPPVFGALARKDNPPMETVPEFRTAAAFGQWCSTQRNDLQAPAMCLAPVISQVLDALAPSLLARMSGSGATCFGLCESAEQAESLADSIRTDNPDWWVVATTLS